MGARPGYKKNKFQLRKNKQVSVLNQQKAVMSFKLENFVAAPSMELLNLAKKTDLLNIADHYALTSVKPSMWKHEIKNILIKFLVGEEILDCSCDNMKSSDRYR